MRLMLASFAAKPGFANGVLRFVNRASRRKRWTVLVVAGALVAAIAGPFGTNTIPYPPRAGFWLSVMLWNFAKWEVWFAVLGRRGIHWRKSLLLGLPIIPLPLPLEVDLGLRVFADTYARDHLSILLRGAAIAGLLLMALMLLPLRSANSAPANARFPGTAIRCREIAALVAEDHYVRLHLADGSSRLLLMRFSDAVAAMAGESGERLHRGAWLAESHRGPAECRNRRWLVRATGEVWLPVSRSRVAGLREKGWLAREG
jgi:hypothetical protein